MSDHAPRYTGLAPASNAASRAAHGSSRKRDTKPELALRRALFVEGLRYRVDVADLPGRPDIVFPRQRVAIFVDGDFWHGRQLKARLTKLARGHNAPYWVAKIKANVARDARNTAKLRSTGWRVLRYWESDVLRDIQRITDGIGTIVRQRARERDERS